MSYLEYVELQEARQSSKRAMWIAIAAMIISGVLAVANLVVSLDIWSWWRFWPW